MDHLVFGASDLSEGVDFIERLFAVETEPGGRHEGFGTHNRLVGFGGRSYMEVVSPDPSQPAPPRPRWFGLDHLEGFRLVTWCAAATDLESLVQRAHDAGLTLGSIREGQRRTESGEVLRWRMTDPWSDRAGGVLPFFIDWGDSPHPGGLLKPQCEYLGLAAEHPDADRVRRWVEVLGLEIDVHPGPQPVLFASIRTPTGEVELC